MVEVLGSSLRGDATVSRTGYCAYGVQQFGMRRSYLFLKLVMVSTKSSLYSICITDNAYDVWLSPTTEAVACVKAAPKVSILERLLDLAAIWEVYSGG